MTTLADLGKDARYKLTYEQYDEIGNMYFWQGMTMQQIAKHFKISHQYVSKVIDINGTADYWNKLTAKRNLKKYRTSPTYRKQCAMIKSKIWYKRKKLKI